MTESTSPSPRQQVADFIEQRARWIVGGIAVLGLVLRCTSENALGQGTRLTSWIHPDEGINVSIITHSTFADCWSELSSNSHPPVISILLWCMSLVSLDMIWLRMLPLAAGVAAIAGTYLMGREFVGKAAGIVGAFFIALSPAAIEQSVLVRPYTLLLAFVTFGLAALARWLRTRDKGLIAFSVWMSLAVGTQFSAFFIVAALGVGLAAMFVRHSFSAAEVKALAMAFIPVVLVILFLFFFQIRPKLLGKEIQLDAMSTWLSHFLIHATADIWFYYLGTWVYFVGYSLAGCAAIVSVAALLLGTWRRVPIVFCSVILLAVAVVMSAIAQYPFGPTRHSIYLLPFLAVTIGELACFLVRAGNVPAIGFGVVVSGLSLAGEPLTASLGANRIPQGLPPEHTIPGKIWEDVEAYLLQHKETPGVTVMNLQTYYFLMPLLRRGWRGWRGWRGEPKLHHGCRSFRWGQRDFVASDYWVLTGEPADAGEPDHLLTFLRQAAKERPDLRPALRSHVTVMLGGVLSELHNHFAPFLRGDPRQLAVKPVATVRHFSVYELEVRRFEQITAKQRRRAPR